MFICQKCGRMLEDYEIGTEHQRHGYTSLGAPIDEPMTSNCSCGGEYVKATKCLVCGEWFLPDTFSTQKVCDDCLENEKTVNNALEIGHENQEEVHINGFVKSVLTPEKINEILEKWVSENFVDGSFDVVKYCDEDKYYYEYWIEEKYR